MSGYGGVEEHEYPGDDEIESHTSYDEYYLPKCMVPMADMFDIPAKCPKEVSQQLRRAFSLFWLDTSAAAGRIRVALELLMDHLKIKRRCRQSNRKFRNLTLHERIGIFQTAEPALGPQLMALKWLGNTGSHESVLTPKDLLDAFELLDHVLTELIDQRSKKVMVLAKQITSKHRLVRKR